MAVPAGLQDRLRTIQVYDTLLRYGNDIVFDRGSLGTFRRGMQERLYRPPYPLTPLSTAQRFRLLLQELGPTYVKIGQIVSSRSGSLPSEWQEELERLQSDVQPFPFEDVREAIQRELGGPPEKVFAGFEPTPMAAASLAQAHRATLRDGREAVVKVQRPQIHDQVVADVRILSRAGRALERRQRWARQMGLAGTLKEFGSNLLLELDYRGEAYNALRFARNLEGIEGVHIPEVYLEYSTGSVLSLEYIPGVKSTNLEAIEKAGLDAAAIADSALQAAVKMLLIDGFFHGDPHPGNVLVDLETGRLTFIDTGMVGEISIMQRFNLLQLIVLGSRRDVTGFAQSLRSLSEPFRPGVDDSAFYESFERRLGLYMDPLGPKAPFKQILGNAFDVLRDNGLRLDPQLTLAIKALAQAEAFITVLTPNATPTAFVDRASEIGQEMLLEAVTADKIVEVVKSQGMFALREAAKRLPSIQDAIPKWLDQFQRGQVTLKLDTSDLEKQVKGLSSIARGVMVGVLITGVIIASAIVQNSNATGVVARLADVSYVLFAIIGAIAVLALGWRLIRRDRAEY